jgi:hypothetical protein
LAASAAGTRNPNSAPHTATPPTPSTPGWPEPNPIIATGADTGAPPLVKVFDAITGAEKFEFMAYDSSFRGGVRVATADIEGNGIPDIITAPGPGMAPEVRVFSGKTGAPLPGPRGGFLAYDSTFHGGVFVAAGRTNSGFTTNIITAPGAGGGSQVKTFSGYNATLLLSFNAYSPGFNGGVDVAAARFSGKSHDDIITGPGAGSAPVVHVFDGATGAQVGGPLGSFLAYEPTYLGGVFVATGDMNDDGTPDIITGPGAGHSPEVKVFSGAGGAVLRDFQAFDPTELGGVRVASAYIDNDPYADIVAAEGVGGEPRVRVFSGATGLQLPPPVGNFLAYPADQRTGIFVAAANDPSPMIKVTPTAQTVIFGGTAALDIFAYPVSGETVAGYTVVWGDGAVGGPTTSATSATADHVYNDIIYNYTTVSVSWYDTQSGGASTTVDVNVIADPAAAVPPDCGCSGPGSLIQDVPAAKGNPAPMADEGVRFADGVTQVKASELSSAGFGVPWGQTRSWSNGPAYSAGGVNGNGWSDTQLPYLSTATPPDVSSVVVFTGGSAARYYDWVDGINWQPRYFDETTLVHNSSTQEYVLTDESGAQLHFYDFSQTTSSSAGIPALRQGKLKYYADPDGNVISVTAFTNDGQIAELQRTSTVGGTTVTESYLYSYTATDVLQNVTLRRMVNGGAWTIARQVQYTYDGSGNLQTAAVEDASTNTLDTYYYRYYVPNDPNTHGYVGGMKYVFNQQSYARLVAALGSNVGSLTDAQVAPYADNYFEYDATSHAVTKEVAQGEGCSSCTGGLGTFTFAYTQSGVPLPIMLAA